MRPAPEKTPTPDADRDTGLPGLRTWRSVYLFVFVVFIAIVVALTVFSHAFA
ncbi:MAG: hypothetical protein HZA32_08395 [Opitutae bacterium]|nr:hypothetical protein [Opitutae bacterium]